MILSRKRKIREGEWDIELKEAREAILKQKAMRERKERAENPDEEEEEEGEVEEEMEREEEPAAAHVHAQHNSGTKFMSLTSFTVICKIRICNFDLLIT